MPDRLVRVLIVAVLALSTMAPARVAYAHSGLAAASPGPDAVVGGTIEEIELLYGDIILSVDGTLLGPDGGEVDAAFRMDSEIRATVVLAEPLSTPGEYEVRHEVLSVDDDVVDDSYTFVYDPRAPGPQLVFLPEEDGGVAWFVWAIGVVGVVVIGVLLWRLLASVRRTRRLAHAAD